MPRILFVIYFAIFVAGCQEEVVAPKIIEETKKSSKQQLEVQNAFSQAQEQKLAHSAWFLRDEKLPLTIIATAYVDPAAKKTKEYKLYKKYLRKIEKDITLLDSVSGVDISSRYSSIKFVDYDLDELSQEKFNAAYLNRYSSKEKLSDILRPDIEKPSQELLIRLNYEELMRGNLTIEGYKSVKQKGKKRNSYYYSLRKTAYADLDKKEQERQIANSIVASLQLSIPEYTPIDRKELVKDGEVLRFITPNANKGYDGVVYMHESGGEIAKLRKKIISLEDKKINEGENIRTFVGHTDRVSALAITPNKKYLLSASRDKTLKLWDINTGEEIRSFEGDTDYITSVKITNEGRYAISGSLNSMILWEISSGNEVRVFNGHDSYVSSIALSSDDKHIVSGSWDKTLKLWSIDNAKEIRTFTGHDGFVNAVVISPDSRFVFSASEDKTIKMWDIQTAKILKTFTGHTKGVSALDISKDGKFLISGSDDKTIKLWDIQSAKELKTFKGHKWKVSSVAFTSDGKYILSGGFDKTIKLWDINTTKELINFNGDYDDIATVVASEDVRFAFSGGADKKIQLWGLPFTTTDKTNLEVAYPKEIERLKVFGGYREVSTKQNILTTPLAQEDIDILVQNNYITSHSLLDLTYINEIASAMKLSFQEPIVSIVFSDSYASKTNTNVQPYKFAYQILSQDSFSIDELYFTSEYSYEEGGYKKLYELKDVKDIANRYRLIEKDY